jgi:seryl-tRNA synthetase
LSKFTET